MGAEREDSDATKRVGTEPGLGKPSGPSQAAAAVAIADDDAGAVDFDALHAALGDPIAYEEPSGPAIEKDEEIDDLDETGRVGLRIGESSGQSSATYSSARPRTIPPTRAPVEDLNAPAVIVASDTDTVPTAPPQMTVPLHRAPPPPPPFGGGQPGSNPHVQVAHAPSGPHGIGPGHPSSGPHAAAAAPFTPQPFPVPGRGAPQMTMRMPDRPPPMKRGKTPTIVVRPRKGPSAKQKLVVFMVMLLVVTACGVAVIILRKPALLGLGPPSASAPPTASAAPPAPSVPSSGAGTGSSSPSAAAPSASVSATANGSASAAASAKKVVKPAPPPHPAGSAPR
jgi:hypothetical protein